MVANPDTIVAMATPAGRGGIGIVRLSGGLALEIVSRIAGGELWPRYAHYRKFRDGGGNTIDEGVVIHFPAPGSYTGEQVAEMHAHGNRLVLARLIARAVELGARPARPGEFTERAFHNGRIDLVQAEAIADLIESASEQAARSAVRSLEGDFSRRVNRLLDTVIEVRAGVEGALDFPDEDADFLAGGGPAEKISACRAELAGVLSVARQGTILNEGIIAVIAGRPNVGKSTLLNALAGREAAIVTASPGTTRDLIEQDIAIDGIPVRVVDTAGLRSAGDEAEQEGIRRALAAATTADILFMVNEYGEPIQAEAQRLMEDTLPVRPVLLLQNKIDLHRAAAGVVRKSRNLVEINISAKYGTGVEVVQEELKDILGMKHLSENVFIARRRHLEALARADLSLVDAAAAATERRGLELVAEHLRHAQHALGEITGVYAADDLLGEIFSRFCLGK